MPHKNTGNTNAQVRSKEERAVRTGRAKPINLYRDRPTQAHSDHVRKLNTANVQANNMNRFGRTANAHVLATKPNKAARRALASAKKAPRNIRRNLSRVS